METLLERPLQSTQIFDPFFSTEYALIISPSFLGCEEGREEEEGGAKPNYLVLHVPMISLPEGPSKKKKKPFCHLSETCCSPPPSKKI